MDFVCKPFFIDSKLQWIQLYTGDVSNASKLHNTTYFYYYAENVLCKDYNSLYHSSQIMLMLIRLTAWLMLCVH